MPFFSNLNFSSSNEDGETERAALAGAQHILCVTGTGTRVLDLLVSEVQQVVAIDANRAQNALLALKMAAMERLERKDYLAFLGIARSDRRLDWYSGMRGSLSSEIRDFWDRNRRLIAAGIWSAGKWEKLLRWNAFFLALFRGRDVTALLDAASPAEQAEVWQRRFKPGDLNNAIEAMGRDIVWRLVMREPAGLYLPDPATVAARIAADFERASRAYLFRHSDIATLALKGRNFPDGALPVHLRVENYDRVRTGLSKIHLLSGGLAGLASYGTGLYDGFSLSDFGSYCGPQDYAQCWQGIVAAAAPSARFCERIFMNEMAAPSAQVKVDPILSESLSNSDRSIIYRIRAGTIEPGR